MIIMKKLILKHALANAVEHKGKANNKAVLGKILAERPELKKDVKKTIKEIEKIVKRINSWSLKKQENELKKFRFKKIKKEQRKGLPELPEAKTGKVITRIPPEPSKYIHIGHALSFVINYMYANDYKGKCILRFEDTNPEKVKKEYVDAIKEDIKYLGIKPNKTIFVSDDLPKMYKLAEKIIKNKQAYVCSCKREEMKKLRYDGKECKCRKNSIEKNKDLWEKMLKKKFKEGEAVLRLKINMQAENYTMRDPVIFRITYTEHFLQGKKYCVWPLYDFENAIEDELYGITHILRSAEFGEMRIELQNHIKDILGFKKQPIIQYGRFNVIGAITQGRLIRKLIEEGKIKAWDDPRLVTLKALKKRGIIKQTYYEIAKNLGLSKTSANIDWNLIAAENRKLIDATSERYFFVAEPVEIQLDRIPKKTIKAPLFPGKRKYRKIPVTKKIFIEKQDFVANHGKEVRLMHFCNIKLEKKAKVTSIANKDIPKIHWIGTKNIKVKLVMPDAREINGLAEPEIKNVKPDQIIQAERIGFFRCDKKNLFYFAHK